MIDLERKKQKEAEVSKIVFVHLNRKSDIEIDRISKDNVINEMSAYIVCMQLWFAFVFCFAVQFTVHKY